MCCLLPCSLVDTSHPEPPIRQCIIDIYGGDVTFAGEILHGKTSPLAHDSKGVYTGLAQGLPVTRYHSLAGTHVSLPKELEVSSWIANPDGSRGVIMGVRHREHAIEGVQFHPESILSAEGRTMFRNFVRMQGGSWKENAHLLQAGAAAGPTVPVPASEPGPAPGKPNILQKIYTRRKELVAAQRLLPSQRMADLEAAYRLNAAPPLVPLLDRLRQSPFDVALMAEIKRASPSKGIFAIDIDAPTQAHKYALAGASVISVLTEPDWFKGSIEDLRAVRQVLGNMPGRPAILRKEFIFDEYQILEARLAGADTVLLIVKMLDGALLERLYSYSLSLGMEPLVEVQNAEEMTLAVALGAKVIGVNNRNLESFEVDLGTTGRLRSMVPQQTIICALSGINTHDDVLACKKDGVNAILVGESIMRAPDASSFIRQLCSGNMSPPPSPSSTPLLVKVCGTRTAEAALEAAKAGADLVGIILVPGARRCVPDDVALSISSALRRLHSEAPTTLESSPSPSSSGTRDFFALGKETLSRRRPLLVGVFQNQPLAEVLEKQARYRLDVVQLHGNEPVEWARLIPVPVVRKFRPGEAGIGARGYHVIPLLDSGSGSGEPINISAVSSELEKDSHLRVLLAGGLSPDTVADTVAALGESASHVVGVDVSSGVEEDGVQSLAKIRAFVEVAKRIR